MGMNSRDDLAAIISKRQGDRKTEMSNFLAGLEEKYGSTSNKKRKTTKMYK